MKTPLRYMYNPAFFDTLCPVLNECIPGFDSRDFIFRVFNNAWPDMELKERVTHIANVLGHFLPKDFPSALQPVISISRSLKDMAFPHHGFENMFLAVYIDLYGEKHPDLSAQALKEIRDTIGAEYAVEAFLIHAC